MHWLEKCSDELYRCLSFVNQSVHYVISNNTITLIENLCEKYVNIEKCHSLFVRYLFPFALNTIAIIYEFLIFTRSYCSQTKLFNNTALLLLFHQIPWIEIIIIRSYVICLFGSFLSFFIYYVCCTFNVCGFLVLSLDVWWMCVMCLATEYDLCLFWIHGSMQV